jgi:hypothetical protein
VTSKEKYRQYCKKHSVDLYANDWWLDAVCGGDWDVVEHDGDRLAFPLKKKYGLKLIAQPKLTLGLAAISPSSKKPDLEKLLELLPSFDLLDVYFLPESPRDFQSKNFKIQSRITHRLTDLSDTKKVFSGFDSSRRQQIRKAEKNISVKALNDASVLFKMISLTFKRQSRKVPYSLDYVKKIYEACTMHDCGKILVAQDAEGNTHGACFIAWDNQTAYYIMGGSDPKFKSSAAYSLLMWEAIKESAKRSKQFDFCGSSIPSVAKFFKGFGSIETPYLHLKKVNSKALALVLKLKQR